MKLLREFQDGLEYELSQHEAACLRTLIAEFPATPIAVARISRTESGPGADDRERLLNESLAGHRLDLKCQAMKLLASGRPRAGPAGARLCLNPQERETLLQLLNDIRVGSWRALGEPADFESKFSPASEREMKYRAFMDLAGYFEFKLLNLENGGEH